jgi:hypothetical protein
MLWEKLLLMNIRDVMRRKWKLEKLLPCALCDWTSKLVSIIIAGEKFSCAISSTIAIRRCFQFDFSRVVLRVGMAMNGLHCWSLRMKMWGGFHSAPISIKYFSSIIRSDWLIVGSKRSLYFWFYNCSVSRQLSRQGILLITMYEWFITELCLRVFWVNILGLWQGF